MIDRKIEWAKETMNVGEAGRLAMRIRREYPSVLIDVLTPVDAESDEWVIGCHHLGWLGSFTIRNEYEWQSKKKKLGR